METFGLPRRKTYEKQPQIDTSGAVLSDSATPSSLNASYFLAVKDNNVKSYFWNAQLEGDLKHTRHARLSLMVKKLDAIKFYKFAESGNTVLGVT